MKRTKDFKYIVVIDWIEIEITTVENSNFNAIRNLFNTKFVEPIEPGAGGATNRFRFKIHDLSSWKSLEDIIESANKIKAISSTNIIAVEISFDTYSIKNDRNALIEKTAEYYRLLQKPSSKNHRLVGESKGLVEATWKIQSNIIAIGRGNSICIGNQESDSVSQRIYFKTTDRNIPLPITEHRARYEVTLRNEACPFKSIEDAKKFNFASLAKWFKFRRIDDKATGLNSVITGAMKQLGSLNLKRRAGGGVTKNQVGTKADGELNSIAYDRLRSLTTKLQKGSVPRKLRMKNNNKPL